MARTSAYNRKELAEKHPELARNLDLLFEGPEKWKNRTLLNVYRNYCIDSKGQTGEPRRTSLGSLIELLENFGFEVEIKINQIPAKHDLKAKILGT